MKRLLVTAAALVLLAFTDAGHGRPAADAAARGTAVGIGLTEWEVAVYRPKVPSGRVRFNITNLGEDGHNFVVKGPGGNTIKSVAEIGAGVQTTVPARLGRRGRYTLVCTLKGHEELGMKSTLKVTR